MEQRVVPGPYEGLVEMVLLMLYVALLLGGTIIIIIQDSGFNYHQAEGSLGFRVAKKALGSVRIKNSAKSFHPLVLVVINNSDRNA